MIEQERREREYRHTCLSFRGFDKECKEHQQRNQE